ncbi:Junctophilin-3, partial [Vespula squamosa]
MFWSEPDEEEEALLCSPALMARRASESWIVAPPVEAMPVAAMTLQRKKSLPDVAQGIQLTATAPLSREEVSVLSSMRREEIRRQIDERERLRANPLLYLVSPQVKICSMGLISGLCGGLVLPATAGNAGALHQHILSPDVLQVAD